VGRYDNQTGGGIGGGRGESLCCLSVRPAIDAEKKHVSTLTAASERAMTYAAQIQRSREIWSDGQWGEIMFQICYLATDPPTPVQEGWHLNSLDFNHWHTELCLFFHGPKIEEDLNTEGGGLVGGESDIVN